MSRSDLPKRLQLKRFLKGKVSNTPVLWWALGFCSALGFLFIWTLWMASVVYSELPTPAKLDETYKSADVIVCLTGGRGRIRRALELYEKGFGKTLYISGTDRQVQMRDVLRELKWVGPVDESHIILENVSTNTLQNAMQVKKFVQDQGLKSVLLVTSVYHVRRSHYIFRRLLPQEVHLDVAWFEQEPFDSGVWWTSATGIWVTMSEFFKFFYAWLNLLSLT